MADHEHFTVEQVAEALRKAKGFYSKTAEVLGCAYNTVANYVNRYPELQELVHEIGETVLDFSEAKLLQQINEGNTTAIIFHLKCKGKKRGYVERQEYDHTGEIVIKSQLPESIDEDKL